MSHHADPIENVKVGDIVVARWEEDEFKGLYVLKVTANTGTALLDKAGGTFPSSLCKFFIMRDENFVSVTADLLVVT